ncbi:hypothetical protein CAPTEDRAFT_159404 [Capitella teleta]|uniref:Plastocyanin-like domain-containing protein n=1 Tax=Capitella teleta TaxID=283909 RepID=R7UNR7_CAPTE|nr:hypothetical protein CAPTEDRAFT_159404 [Capitella teleta]|eukprot:ELU05031.1 hypothetical protein CAPTEDRAFT_159404 [Capitella teleta]
MEHTYEVSIDGHVLTLVALDGQEINPIVVDSVMVHPGERVDFEVTFDQVPDRYWMRSRTIREHVGFDEEADGIIKGTKAIIAYNTATSQGDPATSRKVCSESDVCRVFGCPFPAYPAGDGRQCIHLNDATSTRSQKYLNRKFGIQDDYENVDERFLNFAFVIGSSVKARRLITPRAPLYQDDFSNYTVECTDSLCGYGCKCTHIQELPHKTTVQIVFLSYEPFMTVGAKYLAHHVPHFHGHNFAVMAVGYPPYNETTGQWLGMNPTITCDPETSWRCENPFWTGALPELNTVNPPIKDTVVIPARGYVVVRFKTNNPGYWLLRNQRELPYEEGMAMIFNEAEQKHPKLPKDFPKCYDY